MSEFVSAYGNRFEILQYPHPEYWSGGTPDHYINILCGSTIAVNKQVSDQIVRELVGLYGEPDHVMTTTELVNSLPSGTVIRVRDHREPSNDGEGGNSFGDVTWHKLGQVWYAPGGAYDTKPVQWVIDWDPFVIDIAYLPGVEDE